MLGHRKVLVSHPLVVTKTTLGFDEVLRESVLAVNQNVPLTSEIPLVFIDVMGLLSLVIY